jgi:hypothetical protein
MQPDQALQTFITTALKEQGGLASMPIGFPLVPQGAENAPNAYVPALLVRFVGDPVAQSSMGGFYTGAYEYDAEVVASIPGVNYDRNAQGAIQSALDGVRATVGDWDVVSFLRWPVEQPDSSGDSGRPLRESGGRYRITLRPTN